MFFHDYLDYWARRDPDAVLITDGKQTVTRAEFRVRTHQIANLLSSHLEAGQRFGLLGKNSIDYLATLYAASRCGAVPVPLNYRLAPREWQFILDDAEVRVVIADGEFTEGIDQVRGELAPDTFLQFDGNRDGWIGFEEAVATQSSEPTRRDLSRDGLAYQMYTSGTTGLPKGAMISQRAVTTHIAQCGPMFGPSQNPRYLIVAPMYHAAGAITAINALSVGASLYSMADFVPGEVAQVLAEEGVTAATLVPAMIQALLVFVPDISTMDFSRLETIVYGASPIAAETLRSAMTTFGCDFVQAYGMTEMTAIATALMPEDHVRALNGEEHLLASAGRPSVGVEIRIVDGDDNDLPTGEVGEIIVRCPNVMDGYHKRDEANAETLRGGWMHTGDAGSLDDEGFLFVSDRVKDMIISGGENIYPREIEDVLFQLPQVADAAVIGVPDDQWGESVKAIIQLKEGESLTDGEVLAHTRANLGGYKQPKSVEFIDEIPRNLSGKVLKKDLRAPYWEGKSRAVN